MVSEAVRDAQIGLEQIRGRHDGATNALALLRLGRALAADGQSSAAADAFGIAATTGDDDELHAEAHAGAGAACYRDGRLDEALTRCQEALNRFANLDTAHACTRLEANCAIIHRDRGEWERAAEAAERAQQWQAVAGPTLGEGGPLVVPALVHLLDTVTTEADLGAALEHDANRILDQYGPGRALPAWFAAFSHYRRSGDDDGRYRAILSLGAVYQELGRWDDALRALTDAAQLAITLRHPEDLPYVQAGLAATYVALGHFKTGADLATVAVAGYRAAEDRVGLGRALVTEGQCLEAIGEHSTARQRWKEAQQLLRGHDPEGEMALASLLQDG